MIRIYVVDDHPVLRTGLHSIIERETDILVVGESGNGAEALAAIPKLAVDVVLCDFDLPDTDGLRLARKLLHENAERKILIVSGLDDSSIPRLLFDAGARGYLAKASSAHKLVYAIRQVAAGHEFVDDALPRNVLLGLSPFRRLSAREKEVAALTVQEYTTRQIAEVLRVDETTVRTIRSRVYKKLGLRGAISLSKLAARHGFTDQGG